MGNTGAGIVEEVVDLTAEQVGHDLARPLVGYRGHLNAGERGKQFTGHIAHAGAPSGGKGECPRLAAGLFEQLLHAPRGTGMGHQQHAVFDHPCDWLQITNRVIGQLAVDGRTDDERGCGVEQSLAIGLGMHHQFGADLGVGTAPVVDDELLRERLGQGFGKQPPGLVGSPSRWERNHDAYRTVGPIGRTRSGQKHAEQRAHHCNSNPVPVRHVRRPDAETGQANCRDRCLSAAMG